VREVAHRVSTLEGELVAAWRARDVAEEKILCLAEKTAAAEHRQIATEDQCERLVHKLTLLSLRGSELCMSITGVPPQAPLHEGMHFAGVVGEMVTRFWE
jgi:hypothetical protein